MAYIEEIRFPSQATDVFSRLRVSETASQLHLTQTNTAIRDQILTEGQVSGTGTSATYDVNTASTVLTAGTTTGLRRLRSKFPGYYIAGNALLCLMTFNFESAGQANVVKRVGYFGDKDGLFLQQVNGVLSFFLRTFTSGSAVETVVAQTNWNKDKFDGTSEGYNLDQTKQHLMFIQFKWLALGPAQMGFFTNDGMIVAHEFNFINSGTSAFISNPNQFLNYEIQRTVAGGTSENFRAICGAVKSEGGSAVTSIKYAIEMDMSVPRVTGNAQLIYPLIIFRTNNINARITPVSYNVSVVDNANYNTTFYLLKNPTFSASISGLTVKTTRSINYINNNPSLGTTLNITNVGTIVSTQIGAGANNALNTREGTGFDEDLLGSDVTGTAEYWCLAVRTDTASVTIAAATVTFLEQF